MTAPTKDNELDMSQFFERTDFDAAEVAATELGDQEPMQLPGEGEGEGEGVACNI